MRKASSFNFWPGLVSLLLFAGLCAIAAFWALQLLAPRAAVAPTDTASDQRGAGDSRALLELFGQPVAAGGIPAAVVSNIQVVGITAGDSKGSAILAVDGAPGRFYAIGSTISDGVKLVAVKNASVIIERGGARSELPAPAVANLSVLSSGVGKTRQSSGSPANAPPFGAAAVNAVMPQNSSLAPLPAQAAPPTPGQVSPMYPANQPSNSSPSANIPNQGAISNMAPAIPTSPPGAMAPPPPPSKSQ